MDIRLPRYDRLPGGDTTAEYAGFIGRGPLPADALSELLRTIAAGNEEDRVGLSEREKALLKALEWLADTDHVRFHAEDLGVSSRADCPVDSCQYATTVLASAAEQELAAKNALLPGASSG